MKRKNHKEELVISIASQISEKIMTRFYSKLEDYRNLGISVKRTDKRIVATIQSENVLWKLIVGLDTDGKACSYTENLNNKAPTSQFQ